MDVWKRLDQEIGRKKLNHSGDVHVYPSESSRIITDPVTGLDMVVGSCLRQQYFRFNNQLVERGHKAGTLYEKQDVTATQLWKFAASYDTEATIIKKCKEAGIWAENHTQFTIPELNIKGELDIVLLDPDTGELVGADVKSVYGYYGEKAVFGSPKDRAAGRKGIPKEEHMMQIALYAWYWRKEIAYFKILYFSRGSGQREEYTVSLEPDGEDYMVMTDGEYAGWNISELHARYEALMDAIDNQEMPKREYDILYSKEYLDELAKAGELSKTDLTAWKAGRKVKKGDWRCGYCDFKPNCYNDDDHPIADYIEGEYAIIHSEELIPYGNSMDLQGHIDLYDLHDKDIEITLQNGDEIISMFTGLGKDYLKAPIRTWAHLVPPPLPELNDDEEVQAPTQKTTPNSSG